MRLRIPWALLFVLGCCVDPPNLEEPPIARIIVAWDPLDCGEPHRVAMELEDEAGEPLSTSAPCDKGAVEVDARHYGIYRGRIYTWVAGEAIRAEKSLRLTVDESISRWFVDTPK